MSVPILRPLLLAARVLACGILTSHPLAAVEIPDPERFEREILAPSAHDALQLEVLDNGDVLFAEFEGELKLWDAKTGVVHPVGKLAVHAAGEVGLLGLAIARDFQVSGHLFTLFCPESAPGTMRVSRWTCTRGKLLPDSEKILLSWPYDTEHVFHMGGGLWMDAKSDLYVGTGDNCHWNPGLPVDSRPGRKNWDAQRSAANSRDLRGKILRIHPLVNGGYTIPDGNLFPGGQEGAPEIYCMGLRNPFRISVDDTSGTLFIADVGPNVLPELQINPSGYEELNATRAAANFGWPYFVGPNEALPLFDFERNRPLGVQQPQSPKNESPNNTGVQALPPARGALLWYSNLVSRDFPTVGSGGRTLMTGPVYRYSTANPSQIKFPEFYHGRLFLFEWMRNWIQTAQTDSPKFVPEPFLASWNLRRPIDMKFGPDGALYMLEYGDQWWKNSDSRLVRIVYRRGNRPPRARITAQENAGVPPFHFQMDATASSDPDGDPLQYTWTVNGQKTDSHTAQFHHSFDQAGSFEVAVTVSDPAGASSVAKETVHVGNGRPVVRFQQPVHGSFFDWNDNIPYSLRITESDGDSPNPGTALVRGEFRGRRFAGDAESGASDPGLSQMRGSTCFSCHQIETTSAGPAYRTVAMKYKNDAGALERLSQKVLSGGTGVWGQLPMPPHPQHTPDQIRQMIAWVLALGNDGTAPVPGAQGVYRAPQKPGENIRANEGVLILTAAYTDDGRGGTFPRLEGKDTVVLHSRRKKAALYDINHGMAYVEQVEGEMGIVGHFKNGTHILWKDLRLQGIQRAKFRAGCFGKTGGRVELRAGSPEGPLIASIDVPPTGEGAFRELSAPLFPTEGLLDLCVVARCPEPDTVLGLNWVEFLP